MVDCRHAPDPAPATLVADTADTAVFVAVVGVAGTGAAFTTIASRGAACVVGGVWAVADRTGLGRDPPAGQRAAHARRTSRPSDAVR